MNVRLNLIHVLSARLELCEVYGMKNITTAMFSFPVAIMLAGCASSQHALLLDPVGPAPTQQISVIPQGTLIVYSAYDSGEAGTTDFRDIKRHTDYKIYTGDGKLLEVVHNHLSYGTSDPTSVALPPATYRVVADSNGSGTVTVPVAILANQITFVHLEGGGWRGESKLDNANAVRLPSGQIIGYRATTDNTRTP